MIGREGLSNHADHGDGARHRGLEIEIAAIGLRELKQVGAAFGKERLVGGDHVLLRVQRRSHQPVGHVDSADELDHDIDIISLDHLKRVGEQSNIRILRTNEIEPGWVLVRHCGKPDCGACARADHLSVLQQRRDDALADHAATA